MKKQITLTYEAEVTEDEDNIYITLPNFNEAKNLIISLEESS